MRNREGMGLERVWVREVVRSDVVSVPLGSEAWMEVSLVFVVGVVAAELVVPFAVALEVVDVYRCAVIFGCRTGDLFVLDFSMMFCIRSGTSAGCTPSTNVHDGSSRQLDPFSISQSP